MGVLLLSLRIVRGGSNGVVILQDVANLVGKPNMSGTGSLKKA